MNAHSHLQCYRTLTSFCECCCWRPMSLGLMLQQALPGVPDYRRMPTALLRGWMLGKVGGTVHPSCTSHVIRSHQAGRAGWRGGQYPCLAPHIRHTCTSTLAHTQRCAKIDLCWLGCVCCICICRTSGLPTLPLPRSRASVGLHLALPHTQWPMWACLP